MTTTTRPLSFIAVMALIGAACSSKDAVLRARDGAVDQSPSGTGGALPDSGGAGGALWGSGGNSSLGTGGRTTGAGGSVPGGGGSGSGGIVPGTGGVGTGGILPGTGGSGRGGSGSGGTVSTGGNSGGAIGTGGAGGQGGTGQGGTGQGGTAWYDAGTDAAVDASQPECPSSAPGGSCSVSSTIICYYGDDTRWFCKTSAKCSQGTWVVSDPMPECTATPDPSCPADPATGPVPTCSTDGGTNPTCVYSTQFCKCGYGGTPWPSWKCSANLPAECPALRPGDGSPCTTTSGVWCTYGLSCSGSDMQCIEGKWVTLLLACA